MLMQIEQVDEGQSIKYSLIDFPYASWLVSKGLITTSLAALLLMLPTGVTL